MEQDWCVVEYPHTITIYNKIVEDREDKYFKFVLSNVLWYGSNNINISGKGIENSNEINIFIPKESLSKYKTLEEYKTLPNEAKKDYFTLCKGDLVLKGEHDDITSIKDLNNYEDVITITKINDYLLGTDIDNILIEGK